MRSSVCTLNAAPGENYNMNFPDYGQTTAHHSCLLVLIRGIGPNKPRTLQKIFERIQKVNNVKIKDSSGQTRDIFIRYVREHAVENNEWGDFQTHRRLLGLITVGKFESQGELNELCRVHESLKVKYTSTLYDTRSILFAPSTNENDSNDDKIPLEKTSNGNDSTSNGFKLEDNEQQILIDNNLVLPTIFKSRGFFYVENNACHNLESRITDFIHSLFWILESKRLERTKEKFDKVSLLLAPFEKKDFVGLDMESRVNKKRIMGRVTKNLADLTLQCGLMSLEKSSPDSTTSSASSSESSNLASLSNLSSDNSGGSSNESDSKTTTPNESNKQQSMPSNILQPDEIAIKYREAIINYSKYRMAGIIETEAALKAARICIEQNQNLDVAMFLQNVLYINLNMNEQERVRRFETLTELYQQIGYHRKAAFCQRLAAWRHIAQSNTNPDWQASYRLMLESFRGHKLSLEPTEVLTNNQGWPCLQIDLLQQLVGTARRLGQSALATRHMTFLLQTQWKNLSENEQREMCLQLQSLSAQCEGSPVPLFLENGTVIPPANLTDLPYCLSYQLEQLPLHLRPFKIEANKVDCGPFLFTPIHFNSSIDRRTAETKKRDSKISFLWVQHAKSEVVVKFRNPLPFELQVNDMRLLTDGIVFESIPESVVVQANSLLSVSLFGTPLEVGDLELNGYSTHTLGVKSNCRLKHMLDDRSFPTNYKVNVISALPTIELKTSLPSSGSQSSGANVICTAKVSLYNGETKECEITITNTSNLLIEYMDIDLNSSVDGKTQKRMFMFDGNEIKENLPLEAGKSFILHLRIYGDADFIGALGTPIPPNFSSSSTQHHQTGDGPSSFSGVNLLISGTANSFPSRVNSPIKRNNEQTSSFRSSSTSGAVNSGHSSLATMSLAAMINNGNQLRAFEVLIKFRYSGGNGLIEGFCRECSIAFNVELLPSIQITSWDVLPAEVPSQFYLVLDVANLTQHEISLSYPNDKVILIEPKESCRVPVPVERCPLDQILADYKQQQLTSDEGSGNYSGTFNISEIDLPEKLCSEHIAELVNLKYHLSSLDINGNATLRGISLSSTMLDLVTVSPIQWEIKINKNSILPQSEITVSCGSPITIEINISNNQATTLNNLILSVQFYQDYQNGTQNYRLETRTCLSGPNHTLIPSLGKGENVSYEFSALFFTRGRFKVDIQCKNDPKIGRMPSSSSALPSVNNNDTHHVYKFIPSIEITVN
ncbi:CLUMA_CG000135, isoform A [Clunio marinus]|uniref:CLUMA_CG000135, isoform A n=1 Tax=Clunio marinus TaxID=568069 RepID=A0A1J1HFL3_9DIPT|nr:CLUMA_CG000135, isoform A [Clunio marinus]